MGTNIKLEILGSIKNKTFYWLIDTRSAITCMNINSFEMAFGKTLKIGDKCKVDIFIKKRGSALTL
jgi:hypothetical protein